MAGSYTLPQVQVFQTFRLAQNDATQNLNPFVIGPRYTALDYADKEFRDKCTHGTYPDSSVEAASTLKLNWSPYMPELSTPDTQKYSVTMEDAYVKLDDCTGIPKVISPDDTANAFECSDLSIDVVAGDYLKYTNGDGGSGYAKIISKSGSTVTLAEYVPVVNSTTPVSFVAARLVPVAAVDAGKLETVTESGEVTGVRVKANATVTVDGVSRQVLTATAYLNQRSLRTDNVNVIGNVSSDTEIVEKCGPIVPNNPLAYALHCVLRNCASATVQYMAVKSDDVDGFADALEHATNTNDVYALCPITENASARVSIIGRVEMHLDAMSKPDKKSWRIAFVNSVPVKGDSETASAHAVRVATESTRLANRRVFKVFPSSLVDIDGQTVDGMYAAAAVCGLACSVLPQQPITNVEVEGFLDVPDVYATYSRADLDTIAGGGTLIVMQDRVGGPIYVRHQISTAYSKGEGVATAELSMVRNLDSISYYFANRFAPYIGKYNITPDLLAELKAVLHDGLSYLKTATEGNRLIGPQVLDEGTEIKSIYQHPQEKDHVIANVSLNLPAPFNNFDLYLAVI